MSPLGKIIVERVVEESGLLPDVDGRKGSRHLGA